jgi:hypothetical protein
MMRFRLRAALADGRTVASLVFAAVLSLATGNACAQAAATPADLPKWIHRGLPGHMMIYASDRVPAPLARIELNGTFTDQGVTGEHNSGRRLPMRTEIRIESANRHVIELYFTPPGGSAVLATRQTYTRVRP